MLDKATWLHIVAMCLNKAVALICNTVRRLRLLASSQCSQDTHLTLGLQPAAACCIMPRSPLCLGHGCREHQASPGTAVQADAIRRGTVSPATRQKLYAGWRIQPEGPWDTCAKKDALCASTDTCGASDGLLRIDTVSACIWASVTAVTYSPHQGSLARHMRCWRLQTS